jgi:L1 cell adhesion molecule like protein
MCLSLQSKIRTFDVCFDIDQNGILTVSAMENSTGNTNEITITNNKERLSNDEIKRMIREAKDYRVEDKKFLRKAKVMNALDGRVYKMRSAMEKKDINLRLSSQKRKKTNAAITMATNLFDENDHHQIEIDVLEDQLSVLESLYERIMKIVSVVLHIFGN